MGGATDPPLVTFWHLTSHQKVLGSILPFLTATDEFLFFACLADTFGKRTLRDPTSPSSHWIIALDTDC